MFEFIEKVIYINLEKRTDRKESIVVELQKYFPKEKIERFNAIKHQRGNIGCTLSHIAVLELAISQGWKNYLVVEDDAVWSNFSNGSHILEKLSKENFDVIQLGSTFTQFNPHTYRVYNCLTTTAYIVNQKYYSILLENLKEGLTKLIETNQGPLYAIDVYWNSLKLKDLWYVVFPSLLIQKEGYSDIEERNVNYDQFFKMGKFI